VHENTDATAGGTQKNERTKQLESELSQMREDMRSMVESLEAANEELQSVNEEIVSGNEELQSINEEMETSKEELESSNEELLTINQELQMRNEQLAEVQEYSEAVFNTIREAVLVLDKSLRIKNANSCFYKTFKVSESETEGRFLYSLGNEQWNIPRLKELLEEIIPRNAHVNDFEVTHNFPGIGEKVMLLNARRLVRKLHSEHLILLAIEDITHFRKAERVLAEREQWYKNLADNSPMMIWVIDMHKKYSFVNSTWLHFRNMRLEEAIGKHFIEEQMHPDDKEACTAIIDKNFSAKTAFSMQYRLMQGNGYINVLSKGKPNFADDGAFLGFIGSCMEIPHVVLPESVEA
jgi:two-component system, chemotaxis family, CheB/CheR fusion protein